SGYRPMPTIISAIFPRPACLRKAATKRKAWVVSAFRRKLRMCSPPKSANLPPRWVELYRDRFTVAEPDYAPWVGRPGNLRRICLTLRAPFIPQTKAPGTFVPSGVSYSRYSARINVVLGPHFIFGDKGTGSFV